MTESSRKIIVVRSLFNQAITESLRKGAVEACVQTGFTEDNILSYDVPGALEIPGLLKKKFSEIESDKSAGVVVGAIAVGSVIRGSTPHFDYVCQETSRGIQSVSLELNIPITFGVITTDNYEQAILRSGNNHRYNKGYEAGNTLMEVLNLL